MKNPASQPIKWEHCPYLGLHDDSSTSLAYASPWNYCYRAAPPASILVAQQVEACLCPQYVDCPVYLAKKWSRLPRHLRGRGGPDRLRNESAGKLARWIGLLLLLSITILIVFLLQQGLP